MRIIVLDGDTRGAGTPLDVAIEELSAQVRAQGGSCERFPLSQLAIHECVGCFDCWLKTPGRSRLRDDGRRLVEAAARSEMLVFASPMRMGFTSALLKRATDRLIPLLLPYIRVLDGECHHPMRYGRGLDLALLLERGDASDAELQVTEDVYRRIARNMQGELAWVRIAGPGRAGRAGPRPESQLDVSREDRHAMDAR